MADQPLVTDFEFAARNYALADCPEARSVSVRDRHKAVYGQRLPWVANHQAR